MGRLKRAVAIAFEEDRDATGAIFADDVDGAIGIEIGQGHPTGIAPDIGHQSGRELPGPIAFIQMELTGGIVPAHEVDMAIAIDIGCI